MNVSQKCQYALRAIFELSKRTGRDPTRIGDIAQAQAIPPRFLELILNELKHAGFVESRRGIHGGYLVQGSPDQLTVGEIIRQVDGPVSLVRCIAGNKGRKCPLHGKCAFIGMWSRAQEAVDKVYDETTFQDLLEADKTANEEFAPSYCI